jgi:hypothetical protein
MLGAVVPVANAQYTSGSQNPVQWFVDGGLNVPASSTSDLLRTGWVFGFGATFSQPGAPFALRLEFNYAANDVTSHALYQASGATGMNISGGWVDIWSATAGGEYKFPLSPTSYGYVTAGVGAYYTSVQLTEIAHGYVCNPWWNYCYIGTGEAVVASNSTTHFGWNFGGGFAWHMASGSSLFVEARYSWIDTQSPRIKYIPVVFGVRF